MHKVLTYLMLILAVSFSLTCCAPENTPEPESEAENKVETENSGEEENSGNENTGEGENTGNENSGENTGQEQGKFPLSLAGTSWKYIFADSPDDFHLLTFVDENYAYFVSGCKDEYYWDALYYSTYTYDSNTGEGTALKDGSFCLGDDFLELNGNEIMYPVEFVPMPDIDPNQFVMQEFMDRYIVLQQKYLDAYNATAGNKKYDDPKYDSVKESFEMVFYRIETDRTNILKLAYQYEKDGTLADRVQELYDMFPAVEQEIEQLIIDWEAAVSQIA